MSFWGEFCVIFAIFQISRTSRKRSPQMRTRRIILQESLLGCVLKDLYLLFGKEFIRLYIKLMVNLVVNCAFVIPLSLPTSNTAAVNIQENKTRCIHEMPYQCLFLKLTVRAIFVGFILHLCIRFCICVYAQAPFAYGGKGEGEGDLRLRILKLKWRFLSVGKSVSSLWRN